MSNFQHIKCDQVVQLQAEQRVQIADIRDEGTFQQGHIAGAVNLSNANLADFLTHADKQQPLIVVCYHGMSSQGAGKYLAEQGFQQVYSLDGGMSQFALQFPDMVVSER